MQINNTNIITYMQSTLSKVKAQNTNPQGSHGIYVGFDGEMPNEGLNFIWYCEACYFEVPKKGLNFVWYRS